MLQRQSANDATVAIRKPGKPGNGYRGPMHRPPRPHGRQSHVASAVATQEATDEDSS